MRQLKSGRKSNEYVTLLAELGSYYGWNAIRDALAGRIEVSTFIGLIEAGRKQRSQQYAMLFHLLVQARNVQNATEYKQIVRSILGE